MPYADNNNASANNRYGLLGTSTFPSYNISRKKPRRWPLVLRFIKGAIHRDISFPVILHAAFAALIVYLDLNRDGHLASTLR